MVGVVEARVAALAAPGQVLLQGQKAPLLVVAEAVPETNRIDASANHHRRRRWPAAASIDRQSEPAINKVGSSRKLIRDLARLKSLEITLAPACSSFPLKGTRTT